MLVPLYGFLEGDTIGLLVLAQANDSMRKVAERLQSAAAVRVAPMPHTKVLHEGREVAPDLTVAQAGIQALDRIDVVAVQEAPP